MSLFRSLRDCTQTGLRTQPWDAHWRDLVSSILVLVSF